MSDNNSSQFKIFDSFTTLLDDDGIDRGRRYRGTWKLKCTNTAVNHKHKDSKSRNRTYISAQTKKQIHKQIEHPIQLSC